MNRKKTFLIAANRSGAGKTTLTLGILAALVRRGYSLQAFKCGPDFIDPTLHRYVTGSLSYNLDLKMMGASCCKKTFLDKGRDADILVVEGVMGLYDGGEASSAELAKTLGIPVIMVIDARSSAESAVAVLKGFEVFDPEVRIAGVIFNNIGSPRHQYLIEKSVAAHTDIPVIGFMPRDKQFTIPERHLGLIMGDENPLHTKELENLSGTVEASLNLDLMLESRMHSTLDVPEKKVHLKFRAKKKRLALASDEAFCFYYPQNIELFQQGGFEIIPFSPIHDSRVPDGCEMIYFGGGYPENFAEKLGENRFMLDQVRRHFNAGTAIYGECGGFMYLCAGLVDCDEKYFEMAGIFPFKTVMNRRLRRLGYRKVVLRRDCLLGRTGEILHGHEFHYSDIDRGACDKSIKETDLLYDLDNNYHEGYTIGSAVGSYVHLHLGGDPQTIDHMYDYLNQNLGKQ